MSDGGRKESLPTLPQTDGRCDVCGSLVCWHSGPEITRCREQATRTEPSLPPMQPRCSECNGLDIPGDSGIIMGKDGSWKHVACPEPSLVSCGECGNCRDGNPNLCRHTRPPCCADVPPAEPCDNCPTHRKSGLSTCTAPGCTNPGCPRYMRAVPAAEQGRVLCDEHLSYGVKRTQASLPTKTVTHRADCDGFKVYDRGPDADPEYRRYIGACDGTCIESGKTAKDTDEAWVTASKLEKRKGIERRKSGLPTPDYDCACCEGPICQNNEGFVPEHPELPQPCPECPPGTVPWPKGCPTHRQSPLVAHLKDCPLRDCPEQLAEVEAERDALRAELSWYRVAVTNALRGKRVVNLTHHEAHCKQLGVPRDDD